MSRDIKLIADFVAQNRKILSSHMRSKLISAGAKSYVDGLGKSGIDELDRESAGMLLDIACALMRRIEPDTRWQAEAILPQFPEDLQKLIKLPRSLAYNSVTAESEKMKARKNRDKLSR